MQILYTVIFLFLGVFIGRFLEAMKLSKMYRTDRETFTNKFNQVNDLYNELFTKLAEIKK
ncbi:hypothetical protein M8193_004117 [Escherichia coli]|nr:hypothetical protein [Escherichia coli]